MINHTEEEHSRNRRARQISMMIAVASLAPAAFMVPIGCRLSDLELKVKDASITGNHKTNDFIVSPTGRWDTNTP